MIYSGNIRKMKADLTNNNEVNYHLPLFEVVEPGSLVPMNELIGKPISLRFEHQINCVVTGKKIKKTYGDGMSYDAFMESPWGCPSIMNPELSTIHLGIALRDEEWEREHHLQPHIVYLSKTSGIKVGVTRQTQVPTRWIDQGASEAIVLAEVPYRQLAGAIEVNLKKHIADKTNWQQMLKNLSSDELLIEKKKQLLPLLDSSLKQYASNKDEISTMQYPVLQYPSKVTSLKLDTTPIIEKVLMGIKGQYLIFSDGSVFNLRSHAGYKIIFEA